LIQQSVTSRASSEVISKWAGRASPLWVLQRQSGRGGPRFRHPMAAKAGWSLSWGVIGIGRPGTCRCRLRARYRRTDACPP